MPSQFFGLNISYTGLLAANAGINTTANNISNSETDGYSRQQAIQEANKALRTFTTYGCAGAGVDTIAIERIRDAFYDDKYWDNNSNLGDVNAKAYYMESIENYFQDTDDIAGFNTAFNLMFNALEELSKNAGNRSTKAQFVMYSQSLCDYFNSVSTQLTELQKDVNTELKDAVSTINSIAERVATLNKQINVIEVNGGTANELRDKRDLLIDQLSEYVSVETEEIPIRDTNNEMDTGANRYIVKIAGNQLLVDTNEYRTIECFARETNETLNQSDALGLYNLKWSDGNEFYIYSNMIGGRLQGLIQMRDGNNGENFVGRVTQVDSINKKVQVAVTEDYLKDLDKCTLSSSGGIITLGSEEFYYTDWSYNYNPDTDECYYEFKIDENYGECTLSASRKGREAEVGSSVNYQGIPYYLEQLNEFVRLFARSFNDILTQDKSVDKYGDAATRLLLATNANGGQLDFDEYYTAFSDFADGTNPFVTITNSYDSYYKLTAANFAVSDYISADADRLATRTVASDGESKDDVIKELIAMKDDKDKFAFRGGTASEFLQSVLSDAALNAQRANNSVTYYTTMNKTINNQRISISGVDSDDEAVNLVKYQNAYNLASRMIQTFTEIYDRLILETGV